MDDKSHFWSLNSGLILLKTLMSIYNRFGSLSSQIILMQNLYIKIIHTHKICLKTVTSFVFELKWAWNVTGAAYRKKAWKKWCNATQTGQKNVGMMMTRDWREYRNLTCTYRDSNSWFHNCSTCPNKYTETYQKNPPMVSIFDLSKHFCTDTKVVKSVYRQFILSKSV